MENVFTINHFILLFCCLCTSSWAVFGLLSLVSSVPLLQGQMQWCYFQALLTNHTLSSWPCLNPSLSSYCFKADLVYNQGHCCRIQIRDIRVLQGCTWALLSCSSGELMATRRYRDWKKLDNIQGEDISTAYYWLDRAISRKKMHYPFSYTVSWMFFSGFFYQKDRGFEICSTFHRDSMQCREAVEFPCQQLCRPEPALSSFEDNDSSCLNQNVLSSSSLFSDLTRNCDQNNLISGCSLVYGMPNVSSALGTVN